MNTSQQDLTPAAHRLDEQDRAKRFGHHGGVLWLTGYSGAGKSSLAMALEQALIGLGYACYVLDGDNVRAGLNSNLGFSPEDRSENIRRVGEVAALFADAGLICISAFISPYREDRQRARQACKSGSFHEIHVAAALEACEARDVKGLYRKARAGTLIDFTGISAPYEAPEAPELRLDTSTEPLADSLQRLLDYVQQHFPLHEPAARDLA
ncbi:adenylyl-sulfate kinase [Paucibacter sp. APW11]|uniref:Adenylyl-sulfate kinase n=1 Tax=Roseateles aquae TaxID=3077235 RepID=A0ABU3PD39_9BURK|nr:adenylyl-sulfate kinase [Paucibacter sp. APW11]MDT9000007.1 adenylyl-sulfate kinase [Paucibacter sp. APW11]